MLIFSLLCSVWFILILSNWHFSQNINKLGINLLCNLEILITFCYSAAPLQMFRRRTAGEWFLSVNLHNKLFTKYIVHCLMAEVFNQAPLLFLFVQIYLLFKRCNVFEMGEENTMIQCALLPCTDTAHFYPGNDVPNYDFSLLPMWQWCSIIVSLWLHLKYYY